MDAAGGRVRRRRLVLQENEVPGRVLSSREIWGAFSGRRIGRTQAFVICLQILWPVFQVFSGVKNIETPFRFKIRINSDLKRRKGRPELIRSKLKVDQQGELYADIPPAQSSSQISSLIDLLLT